VLKAPFLPGAKQWRMREGERGGREEAKKDDRIENTHAAKAMRELAHG